MDWINNINPLITTLIGAITGVVGSYTMLGGFKRGNRRDDFITLKNAYNDEFKKHKDLIADLEKRVEGCVQNEVKHEMRLKMLSARVKALNMSAVQLPVPMWMKDEFGTMIMLNDEYESRYLSPLGLSREDYIGKDDIEMWGKDIGEAYQRNDRTAMSGRKPYYVLEPLKTPDGMKRAFVVKFPILAGGIVVSMAGAAFDEEMIDSFIARKNETK